MAIQCSKCNLYRSNHEVRNGVCEECYEESVSSSSEDENYITSSRNEVESVSNTCTKCKVTKLIVMFYKNKSKEAVGA